MEKSIELIKIKEELEEVGYATLSAFLSNALERQSEKDTHILGFVGDDLVGKSTIINSFLGDEILPTSIIPSLAETTIKYGNERVIYDSNGSIVDENDLLQSIEENDSISVFVNNEFLKNNSLIIKEYHNLLSQSNLSDMAMLEDVYKCDAVVLVMTAEHLLSESECTFIENYIKYVGDKHLLIIVNKLTSVADGEVMRVLDYVKNQITLKFADIKWTVFDLSGKYKELIQKYVTDDFKSEIMTLFGINQEDDNSSMNNVLRYIKEQLEIQRAEFQRLEEKSREERIKEKKKKEKQKELEKASIEGVGLTFQQKKNNTVEAIDNYIKNQFDEIFCKIENAFLSASNKYFWYEKELDAMWRKLIIKMSDKVNNYTSSAIGRDVDWLNAFLETELGIQSVTVNLTERGVRSVEKVVPYGTYKKYVPVGIAGGVFIGYSLFRIIGAAIGIGGGLLTYSYLEMKDSEQTEEIRREIRLKIKDISADTRKMSQKEIEKIYADILSEFENEAMDMLEEKYRFDCTDNEDCFEQRKRIDNLLKRIEEM